MKQPKRILAAVFAAFGNFNFRRAWRVFGALCLSAALGIGNAAFAGYGNATTGERITTTPERIDIAAKDPDAVGKRRFGRKADGSAPIHEKARKGDARGVRHYLLNGENPNVQMNNGRTPLHIAAKHGHINVAEALLNHGAKLEIKEEFGKTPIFFAAGISGGKMTKFLIDKGANISAKDVDDRTPLHWAVNEGKTSAARVLVDAGASVSGYWDKDGKTPLDIAERVQGKDSEIARILQASHQREIEHRRWVIEQKRKWRECLAVRPSWACHILSWTWNL